jgi:oxygen-independent coproporphyrinogen-3 oxidase
MRALENIEIATNATSSISINIDFILGLPYTTSGEILHAIKELHNQFPHITHTSVYMLEDEVYPKHWKANSITEDQMQTEFLDIIDYFQSIGWHHYELSNFAKPGYESVHNQAYWDHSDTRGFGLSAASYIQ